MEGKTNDTLYEREKLISKLESLEEIIDQKQRILDEVDQLLKTKNRQLEMGSEKMENLEE